jgi:cobalt-zinc-cadmium efflux system membrane fusion protein
MTFRLRLTAALVALAAVAAATRWLVPATVPAAVPSAAAHEVRDGLIRIGQGDLRRAFVKVATVPAQPEPLADPVAARIAYDESRTSRIASPVLGRVMSAPLEVGDSVRPGQTLAELDSPDLATAQADLRKALADEQRKRLALERARQLFGAGVLAQRDLENADADFRQADAETRRARQRVHNLHAEDAGDGKFALRAPIAGIVADKQVNPGQEVRPDQAAPLLVVSDLRRVWALADVPERLAVALHRGQDVLVETDAWPGQQFPARIDRIGVVVDPATRRIQVRCALDNPEGRLKPDMFARVAFVSDTAGAKAVPLPNAALFTEGANSYVFVEMAPGVFQKRRVGVKIGGADHSYIVDGLSGGEPVVVEGALLLNAEVESHAR